MKECIDIFSRILIATITFVVPIIINLLSTFAEGEKRRKELASSTQEEITRRASEELQSNPNNFKETISRTNKQYNDVDAKTNHEIDKLNPIKQFWKIFASLLFSLVFLFSNCIIRADYCGAYNHSASVISLSLSVLAYSVALFFIIRILYTINDAKKVILGK